MVGAGVLTEAVWAGAVRVWAEVVWVWAGGGKIWVADRISGTTTAGLISLAAVAARSAGVGPASGFAASGASGSSSRGRRTCGGACNELVPGSRFGSAVAGPEA